MYINSLTDLRHEIAECTENMDLSQYSLSCDELIDAVTSDFRDILNTKYEFSWGMELPEMAPEVVWDLFKPYEND